MPRKKHTAAREQPQLASIEPVKHPNPLLSKLKRGFISGVIVFAPLGITVFVFSWIFRKAGGILGPYLHRYLPDWLFPPSSMWAWDIVATLALMALITALGLASHYFLGKWFIGIVDRVMHDIPGVKTVYGAVKQIIDTLGSQKSAFRKVVMVEFPSKGIYSIGFLTKVMDGELPKKSGKSLLCIFVPTAPNVTTGFVIMVPKEEVVDLDMTPEEGMKLILSVGAVEPAWGAAAQPMKNEK